MDISLHYGDGRASFELPQANVAGVIRPRSLERGGPGNAAMIQQAVTARGDEFSQTLSGQTVGVLLADATRDVLLEEILPLLLPMSAKAEKVIFFICTGTHTADTPENQAIVELLRGEAAKAGIGSYEVVAHDCRDAEFVSAGTTQRGTPILFNARLQEPDVFVVLSDVKHHYFAGYSNPVKNFVPGLCAFETTERNHSWTMDARSCAGVHPWHPDPALRDNPLAQDQAEAMTAIVQGRSVWALVTLSSEGRIRWADFGLAAAVTPAAFLKADAWNCFAVAPVRKMIVSPGGLPHDVDLYISQRALELTAEAVEDGGEILFLSACPKGVGSLRTKPQFYDKLIEPLDAIEASERDDYRLFSHKPWRFARLIRRLDCLWVYSQIASSDIEKMHMTPCANPQAVVAGWLAQNPAETILVVDGANKLLLRRQA